MWVLVRGSNRLGFMKFEGGRPSDSAVKPFGHESDFIKYRALRNLAVGLLVCGSMHGGLQGTPCTTASPHAAREFRVSRLIPTLVGSSQQADQGTAPPLRTAGGCAVLRVFGAS